MKRLSKNINVSFLVKKNISTFFEGYNYVGKYSNVKNTSLGLGSYIGSKSFMPNCLIGKFCSIGSNIQVISGTHPTTDFISTHPAFYSPSCSTLPGFVSKTKFKEFEYIDDSGHTVEIGNDVWIASNVIIIAPVKIGNGAIIASGAVVTSDILPYSIVGGVPAKEIRKRFDDNICEIINSSEWWNWDLNKIKSNADCFENPDSFLELIRKG